MTETKPAFLDMSPTQKFYTILDLIPRDAYAGDSPFACLIGWPADHVKLVGGKLVRQNSAIFSMASEAEYRQFKDGLSARDQEALLNLAISGSVIKMSLVTGISFRPLMLIYEIASCQKFREDLDDAIDMAKEIIEWLSNHPLRFTTQGEYAAQVTLAKLRLTALFGDVDEEDEEEDDD